MMRERPHFTGFARNRSSITSDWHDTERRACLQVDATSTSARHGHLEKKGRKVTLMWKKVCVSLAIIVTASGHPGARSVTGVRFVQWPLFSGLTVGSGVRVDTTGDAGSESPAGTIWVTTRQMDPKL